MPEAPRLCTISCSPSRLVATACEHVVRVHRGDLPDLTAHTLVVPQSAARQTIALGLQAASGAEVLLLPRITTLREWADGVGLDHGVLPAAAREAMLYQALSRRGWFDDTDLWAIVSELTALFDELTRWRVGMPASLSDFERRLDQAYRARAGASFAFEARLIHELWHVLGSSSGRPDAEAAYQLRLGRLAQSMNAPLYTVGLGRLAPAEEAFLEHCATRVDVVQFIEATAPHAAMSAHERTLALAWPDGPTSTLQERARELSQTAREPGLAGRVLFFGARGIEEEARATEFHIRKWLRERRSRIGVVVLDRLTARRTRALLERGRILVRDETGWAFSTTSAATVLSRWFDVCASGFYHRDLLDFLKSPFAFHEWARDSRQQALWRLERAVRRANIRTGLERYLALARHHGDAELQQMLLGVQRAAQLLDRARSKPLSAWLLAVDASLEQLGVRAGLEFDAAGTQLLELLSALRSDLLDDGLAVTFAEFRRWLARQLEAATFRDTSIDSPVVFTSLPAARLRCFDAALVLGADAAHLSGDDGVGLFFNQSVRRELGLPDRARKMREIEEHLFSLLCNVAEVVVTWQSKRDGEDNLLAPVFERLRTLHALAWQDPLEDFQARQMLLNMQAKRLGVSDEASSATVPPAPRASPENLPTRISASAYNALMACPYQFFARYVLRLRQLDEVQEELDKADYGSLVHEVLHRFHRAHPRALDLTPDQACAALEKLSCDAFAEVIRDDYLASAWLARWKAMIPRYLHWQRQREDEGWRFSTSELDRCVGVQTPAGRRLDLTGRIDRVDTREDGTTAVIDYKTQAAERLTEKLRIDGEDVQLPVYALLWGGPVAAALFLCVDRNEIDPVSFEGDIEKLAAAVRERIGRLYDRISEGAPLPAQGIDAVCRYCEVSGLCRRKHWA